MKGVDTLILAKSNYFQLLIRLEFGALSSRPLAEEYRKRNVKAYNRPASMTWGPPGPESMQAGLNFIVSLTLWYHLRTGMAK